MNRISRRIISLLLSVLMIVALMPLNAFATDAEVASIEVVEGDVLYENASTGYWYTIMWNGGSYEIVDEYYIYAYGRDNVNLKVTYTDGTVKYSNYNWTVDDQYDGYGITSNTFQGEDGVKWTIGGTNIVTFEYMGKTCEYNVQIEENPVESIEVAEGNVLYENAAGYWSTQMRDTVNEEFVTVDEYYVYDYDPYDINLKVTYTDGTVKYSDYEWAIDDQYEDCNISFEDSQGKDDVKWTIGGTNIITFEYMGRTCEYSVQIEENPVASIEVVEGDPLYENTGGYWYTEMWNTEIGRYETVDEYFLYIYDPSNVNLKVTYTDETVKYSDYSDTVDDQYDNYSISHNFPQGTDGVKWTVGGTNTITFEYMGKTCEYNVDILGNPIDEVVGISVTSEEPMELLENIDGHYNKSYGHFEYDVDMYSDELVFEVTLADGTVITGDCDYVECQLADLYFDGDLGALYSAGMGIYMVDLQDEEPWTVGEQIIGFYIGDVICYYYPVVVESPIESLSLKIKDTLIEGIDAQEVYDYWISEDGAYEESPVYWGYTFDELDYDVTVNYKDGTSEVFTKAQWAKEYPDLSKEFISDQSYENQLEVGTNALYARFGNYICDTTFVLEECPYTGISISGDEKLTLTLTREDGTTETQKILFYDGLFVYDYWYGEIYTHMYTDKGMYKCVVSAENEEDATCYQTMKNISISIGTFTSNTLESSKMMTANFVANEVFGDIQMWTLVGNTFPDFDGTLTAENADYLIGLSYFINAVGDTSEYRTSQEYEYDANEDLVSLTQTVDQVKDRLTKVFNIDVSGFDFTQLESYNDGNLKVYVMTGYGYNTDLDYLRTPVSCKYDSENEQWTVSRYLCDDQKHEVILDKDFKVDSINLVEPTELEITEVSNFVVDAETDYITNIQPTTTVGELEDNFRNDSASIAVVDKDGDALERGYLATGDKVQLMDGTTVIDEKVIVVLGDTSGDGKVRAGDATKVLNQIVDGGALAGAYLAAADASGDGKVRAGDATKILNYIVDGVALG